MKTSLMIVAAVLCCGVAPTFAQSSLTDQIGAVYTVQQQREAAAAAALAEREAADRQAADLALNAASQ